MFRAKKLLKVNTIAIAIMILYGCSFFNLEIVSSRLFLSSKLSLNKYFSAALGLPIKAKAAPVLLSFVVEKAENLIDEAR